MIQIYWDNFKIRSALYINFFSRQYLQLIVFFIVLNHTLILFERKEVWILQIPPKTVRTLWEVESTSQLAIKEREGNGPHQFGRLLHIFYQLYCLYNGKKSNRKHDTKLKEGLKCKENIILRHDRKKTIASRVLMTFQYSLAKIWLRQDPRVSFPYVY